MSTGRSPQVLVLNGGSSSGKTSLARALQEILPGIWLTFGVDTFIDALPGGGDSPRAGIAFAPDGTISVSAAYRTLEDAWYAGLRAMVGADACLILDEVFLSGADGQDRVEAVFRDVEVMWVGVHCSPDVAASREAHRPDRVAGMARAQAASVHRGVAYNVEVDTSFSTTDHCARHVARAVESRVPHI